MMLLTLAAANDAGEPCEAIMQSEQSLIETVYYCRTLSLVELFPVEKCISPSRLDCVHIIAVKWALDVPKQESKKRNTSLGTQSLLYVNVL
jgi:hypothetical protein